MKESTLAELPEDTIARLKGTVVPLGDRLLTAPLSGRPCVFYSAAVILNQHAVTREPFTGMALDDVLVTEESCVPFLFEDGGHHAVIEGRGAKISCAYDHRSESKALFDATPAEHAILERNNLLEQDWWNTRSLEYVEGILAPGEPIVLVGGGTREPDPDAQGSGGYREASRTRFRFTSTKRFQLVISDDPKAQ